MPLGPTFSRPGRQAHVSNLETGSGLIETGSGLVTYIVNSMSYMTCPVRRPHTGVRAQHLAPAVVLGGDPAVRSRRVERKHCTTPLPHHTTPPSLPLGGCGFVCVRVCVCVFGGSVIAIA